jgi:hypothetical protein
VKESEREREREQEIMFQKALFSQFNNKEAQETQSKMLITHEIEYKITSSSTKIPLPNFACSNYEG